MQLDQYDDALRNYLDSISLTDSQDQRIQSALDNILPTMLAEYHPNCEVYAQGSYATDTMVKPITSIQGEGKAGEYDVDIVIERTEWVGAEDALAEIKSLLESDVVYSKMPIDNTKNSCISIEYAKDNSGVAFHVDLVPTKMDDDKRYVPDRKNRRGNTVMLRSLLTGPIT